MSGKELAEAANGHLFIGQAPVVIAACGTDPDDVMACGQHRPGAKATEEAR